MRCARRQGGGSDPGRRAAQQGHTQGQTIRAEALATPAVAAHSSSLLSGGLQAAHRWQMLGNRIRPPFMSGQAAQGAGGILPLPRAVKQHL